MDNGSRIKTGQLAGSLQSLENGNRLRLISPKQFYEMINERLDTPMGLRSVYALIKRRSFPSVKIGGRYYVIESKVEEWLVNQSRMRS